MIMMIALGGFFLRTRMMFTLLLCLRFAPKEEKKKQRNATESMTSAAAKVDILVQLDTWLEPHRAILTKRYVHFVCMFLEYVVEGAANLCFSFSNCSRHENALISFTRDSVEIKHAFV